MSIAERYKRWIGYAAWDENGSFDGRCLGGPYDGQRLMWREPRFPIQMYCSTAEHPPEVEREIAERLYKYNHTSYVWTDSTWVWHDK